MPKLSSEWYDGFDMLSLEHIIKAKNGYKWIGLPWLKDQYRWGWVWLLMSAGVVGNQRCMAKSLFVLFLLY